MTTATMVKAELIPGGKRLSALPKYFKSHMMEVECSIYHLMSRFCQEYQGGYWNFYCLNNGGFYMACDDNESFKISIPSNYFDQNVSADAAGIIVCLYAYNLLCCKHESDLLIDHYYKLLDYARVHPEASYIFRAID